ncbi:MAG: DUF5716 family protein [Defluviitaleaceae bacterium]|nr:DUF5716 family protein [Defluviitaleaceae bacterium]
MNWKKYQEHFKRHKLDEDHFVLGVDLGNATSSIAYFDALRQNAEILDISGGYGKPSVPTVLQYINATDEWIFGEYAVINANGQDPLLLGFVERMGENGLEPSIKSFAVKTVDVAARYIGELIANCKSINPKAAIAGIVAVMPDFVPNEAVAALRAAFETAGYGGLLIDIVQERQAALAYFKHNSIDAKKAQKVLWLDFGDRALRGGLYEIKDDSKTIECLEAAHDTALGMAKFDKEIYDMLASVYCQNKGITQDELNKTEREQLLTFAYGHKDVILNNEASQTRIYYNFVHPPFSAVVYGADVEGITRSWKGALEDFVNRLLGSNVADGIAVVCTGGGFEAPWAKRKIASIFKCTKVSFAKNTKGVLAAGATYLAAGTFGFLPPFDFEITDNHKRLHDIGINIKERFYTILPRGSWLWQKPKTIYVIPEQSPEIELFVRDEAGKILTLGKAEFKTTPKRPNGTTRIALDIEAIDADSYTVKIKDLGFGEMFPATNQVESFEMRIQC